MKNFFPPSIEPRWVGSFKLDGDEASDQPRLFNYGGDNEESVLSQIMSNFPGRTVSEFNARRVQL